MYEVDLAVGYVSYIYALDYMIKWLQFYLFGKLHYGEVVLAQSSLLLFSNRFFERSWRDDILGISGFAFQLL